MPEPTCKLVLWLEINTLQAERWSRGLQEPKHLCGARRQWDLMRMNTICVLTDLSAIRTAGESQELGVACCLSPYLSKSKMENVFAFISIIVSYVTESRYLKCSYWTHLSHLTGLSLLPCTALASDSTAISSILSHNPKDEADSY